MEQQLQDTAPSGSEKSSAAPREVYIVRDGRVEDHKELVKVAKTSPYTGDFSNRVMFSSDAAYDKGWIRVIYKDGEILGYYCVRHKSRGEKATALYFITVRPEWRSKNLGLILLEDMKARSPAGIIQLNVAKKNEAARRFYERHGFTVTGESLGGAGWSMEWRRADT